jgi:hypothetical protein
MAGYRNEERQRNTLGCTLALLWLPLSFLFLGLMALGGFGCEGAPRPCSPDRLRPLLLIGMTAFLGVATVWSTSALRAEKSGFKRNAAALVACSLLVLFVGIVWWILDAF